jgi:predicted metal-dependent phosphotriesterase family hydrolase
MTVMTVRGPIEAAQLGTCYAHEHLFYDAWECADRPNSLYMDPGLTMRELAPFVAAGGRAIIDVTASWPAIGRNPEGLLRVARELDLHIVMATGFYLPSFNRDSSLVHRSSVEELAAGLVAEIEHGWGATGIRPGVLKIATQYGYISPTEERALRAVARAHRRTGVPITTHAELFSGLGLQQLALFAEEGVDPRRVVIGHCGTLLDVEYVAAVCEAGAFAAFDTVGRNDMLPDAAVAEMISELVRRGYGSQLLLSMDVCQRRQMASFGGPGWGYLLNEYVPLLVSRGVAREVVDAMLNDNPARAFAIAA